MTRQDERFLICDKPNLTAEDKARLRELNKLIEKQEVGRLKPYTYQGWMVHHYLEPEQFMASKEARVLRAKSKEGVEQLVRDENFIDYYKTVEDEDG